MREKTEQTDIDPFFEIVTRMRKAGPLSASLGKVRLPQRPLTSRRTPFHFNEQMASNKTRELGSVLDHLFTDYTTHSYTANFILSALVTSLNITHTHTVPFSFSLLTVYSLRTELSLKRSYFYNIIVN